MASKSNILSIDIAKVGVKYNITKDEVKMDKFEKRQEIMKLSVLAMFLTFETYRCR